MHLHFFAYNNVKRNIIFRSDKIVKMGPFTYVLINSFAFMYTKTPVNPEKIKTVRKLIWEKNEIKIISGFEKNLLLSHNIRMSSDIASKYLRFFKTDTEKSHTFSILWYLLSVYSILMWFKNYNSVDSMFFLQRHCI